MFSAVLRNAVFAPRPFAARTALALRAYSTPAGTPPPPADRATPSASSSSGRPLIDLRGARKFSPNEDPDAWWRAESAARRFGTPGNQYTGRSLKVVGGFTGTYRRLMGNLRHTGFLGAVRRQRTHERPSEVKRRRSSERARRRFQEIVRRKVQLVQTLRNRR